MAFATKRGSRGYALEGVDGRSVAARRFRELYTGIEADLGGDLTEGQKAMLARACTLCIWCEEQETAMAKGGAFNPETYSTVSNTLRRLLSDLGVTASDETGPMPKPPTKMRPLLGGPEIPVPADRGRPPAWPKWIKDNHRKEDQ